MVFKQKEFEKNLMKLETPPSWKIPLKFQFCFWNTSLLINNKQVPSRKIMKKIVFMIFPTFQDIKMHQVMLISFILV